MSTNNPKLLVPSQRARDYAADLYGEHIGSPSGVDMIQEGDLDEFVYCQTFARFEQELTAEKVDREAVAELIYSWEPFLRHDDTMPSGEAEIVAWASAPKWHRDRAYERADALAALLPAPTQQEGRVEIDPSNPLYHVLVPGSGMASSKGGGQSYGLSLNDFVVGDPPPVKPSLTDEREDISIAIVEAATDENCAELRDYGNADPFVDAILALRHPEPVGSREALGGMYAPLIRRLRARAETFESQTKWGNHAFGSAADGKLFAEAATALAALSGRGLS